MAVDTKLIREILEAAVANVEGRVDFFNLAREPIPLHATRELVMLNAVLNNVMEDVKRALELMGEGDAND